MFINDKFNPVSVGGSATLQYAMQPSGEEVLRVAALLVPPRPLGHGVEDAPDANACYEALATGLLDGTLSNSLALRQGLAARLEEFFPDLLCLLVESGAGYEDAFIDRLREEGDPYGALFSFAQGMGCYAPAFFAKKTLRFRTPLNHLEDLLWRIHTTRASATESHLLASHPDLLTQLDSDELRNRCARDEVYARRVGRLYAHAFPFGVPHQSYYFGVQHRIRQLGLQFFLILANIVASLAEQEEERTRWLMTLLTMVESHFAVHLRFWRTQPTGISFEEALQEAETAPPPGLTFLLDTIPDVLAIYELAVDNLDDDRPLVNVPVETLQFYVRLQLLHRQSELLRRMTHWRDARVTLAWLNEENNTRRDQVLAIAATSGYGERPPRHFFTCELGPNPVLTHTMALFEMDRVRDQTGLPREATAFLSCLLLEDAHRDATLLVAKHAERQRLLLARFFLDPLLELLGVYNGFVIYQFTSAPRTVPPADYAADAIYIDEQGVATGVNRLTYALWARTSFAERLRRVAMQSAQLWFTIMYPGREATRPASLTDQGVLCAFISLVARLWQSEEAMPDVLCGARALVEVVEAQSFGRQSPILAAWLRDYPYGGDNVVLVKLYILLAQALEGAGLRTVRMGANARPALAPDVTAVAGDNLEALRILVTREVARAHPQNMAELMAVLGEVQALAGVLYKTSKVTGRAIVGTLLVADEADVLWRGALQSCEVWGVFRLTMRFGKIVSLIEGWRPVEVENSLLDEWFFERYRGWANAIQHVLNRREPLPFNIVLIMLIHMEWVRESGALYELVATALNPLFHVVLTRLVGERRGNPTEHVVSRILTAMAEALVWIVVARSYRVVTVHPHPVPASGEDFYQLVVDQLSEQVFIDAVLQRVQHSLVKSDGDAALIAFHQLVQRVNDRGDWDTSAGNIETLARARLDLEFARLFEGGAARLPVRDISVFFKMYALLTINRERLREDGNGDRKVFHARIDQ